MTDVKADESVSARFLAAPVYQRISPGIHQRREKKRTESAESEPAVESRRWASSVSNKSPSERTRSWISTTRYERCYRALEYTTHHLEAACRSQSPPPRHRRKIPSLSTTRVRMCLSEAGFLRQWREAQPSSATTSAPSRLWMSRGIPPLAQVGIMDDGVRKGREGINNHRHDHVHFCGSSSRASGNFKLPHSPRNVQQLKFTLIFTCFSKLLRTSVNNNNCRQATR